MYALSLTRISNLQQSYDLIDVLTGPTLDCGVSCPRPIEKIFYLPENYFKILAGSQVCDRCPLGYALLYVRCKSGVGFVRRCFRDIVQKLELAMNLALYGLLWSLGNQYHVDCTMLM